VGPDGSLYVTVGQFIPDALGDAGVARDGLIYVGGALTVIGVDPTIPIDRNQIVVTANQLLTGGAVAVTLDQDGTLYRTRVLAGRGAR
jgi:hypothetical protein